MLNISQALLVSHNKVKTHLHQIKIFLTLPIHFKKRICYVTQYLLLQKELLLQAPHRVAQ